MRVLLSAYVCAKEAGSEPEIGYTTVLAAARAGHDVTVLTWAPGAGKLRQDLADDAADRLKVVGIEGPAFLDRYLGRRGLGHVHYVAWQLAAARRVRSLESSFDVAHHITFGADWMPSALHALRQRPVVWGPVGGQGSFPWSMAPHLGWRGMVQEVTRALLVRAGRTLTARLVKRCPCLVVAHNGDTASWYERRAPAVVTAPLVAMPPVERGSFPGPSADSEGDRRIGPGHRRMVFIGRLVPWKGCLLAVRTLACLSPGWRLDVYGNGQSSRPMESLARRLGVADRMRLMGHVPRDQIWRALQRADVLILPSVHDSAPQPVAQALRSGCPVVCLDTGGPPDLAGDHGHAVALGSALPGRLAAAVESARRFPPDDRWNEERLPEVIDDLYRRASLLHPGQGSRRPGGRGLRRRLKPGPIGSPKPGPDLTAAGSRRLPGR